MFEARLSRASVLKHVVDAIKDLCKEVNFDVSSSGLSMQSMDTSHVCLVSFCLMASGFERFACEEQITLGVNLEHLSRVLKCADADDSITLRSLGSGSDTLSVLIESEDGGRISNADMKLMSIDCDLLEVPEQQSSVQVLLAASRYQRIMRDLSTFGDALQISSSAAEEEGVRFGVSGDIGVLTMDIRKQQEDESVEAAGEVRMSFALRYMSSFSKAAPLSPRVRLDLVQGMPIRVGYDIGTDGWLKFFLAPKLAEEGGDE